MRILSSGGEDRSPSTALESHTRLSTWTETLIVALLIGIFFTFGFAYSVIVPPFETPDEIHHYAFARHLAQGNPLPIQTVESNGRWEHEGTQAPLYYLILGRLISGIDQNDFAALDQVNPHANLGNPLYPGNKNYMLYSAAEHPLLGTILAVHIGRWFSLVLGACTLLLSYALARLAFAGSQVLPLISLLTLAAIPQVQFISATVSNDNAVIFFATAVLFWLARLLSFPADRSIRWHEWVVLGVLLGAALLSKLQGLGLLPLAGLAIVGMAWLRHDLRLPFRALLPVALPVLLIAGWWYWRNYLLYGDWLGVDQLLAINGLRAEPPTLSQFWGELRGVRYSFWGLFGWFSILMPSFVYTVLDALSVLALFGFGAFQLRVWQREGATALRRPVQRVYLLLLVWTAMLVVLLVYWLTFATSGQGRLLFPALSAMIIFFVLGLDVWVHRLPNLWRYATLLIVPVGLLLTSLYTLVILLPHSYAALAAVDTPPVMEIEGRTLFADQIELVAVDAPSGRFEVGDEIEVTLYLRALANIEQDYPLFIQLLTPDHEVLANITSHPGWGRFPTSLWEPGQIYEDHYRLRIEQAVEDPSPVAADLVMGFFDANTDDPLPIVRADGQSAKMVTLSTIDLLPTHPLDPADLDLRSASVRFGEAVTLIGYQFPMQIEGTPDRATPNIFPVTLLWKATGAPEVDLTAFVHLTKANDVTGAQVAGYDQPPAQGRLPTSHWQPDDLILSNFPVDVSSLSAGVYDVWLGLYADAGGANRLPIESPLLQIRDQRILLGTVQLR